MTITGGLAEGPTASADHDIDPSRRPGTSAHSWSARPVPNR
jgi:hypothetical protein